MSMAERLIKLDDFITENPEARFMIKDKAGEQRLLTPVQLLEYAA